MQVNMAQVKNGGLTLRLKLCNSNQLFSACLAEVLPKAGASAFHELVEWW